MPKASFPSSPLLNRRTFLGTAGLAASAALLAACNDDDNSPATPTDPVLGLGNGEAGVLSYFFMLERFSSAFYEKVLAAPPAGLAAADQALLRDVYRHQLAHGELLAALFDKVGLVDANTVSLLRSVTFRYEAPAFTLTDRAGVLAGAQLVEDLSVAALTGALRLLTTPAYLQLALKMLAVESRHAATVRDLRQPGSFAGSDAVISTGPDAGLNQLLRPGQALTELSKYSSVRLAGTGFSLT